MNSKEQLIEQEAENRLENQFDNNENKVDFELVSDFRLNNNTIQYKTITDEKWDKFCSCKDLRSQPIDELLDYKNVRFENNTLSKLKSLKANLQISWDKDINMYNLFYKENDDGSKGLYIQINTESIDDILVKKIYNENNEFVADDLKDYINFSLYKIEYYDFYVKNIKTDGKYNLSDIYTKKEKSFDKNLNDWYDTSISSKQEFQKEILYSWISTTGLFSFLGILYTVDPVFSYFVIIMLSLAYLLPIFLPVYTVYITGYYLLIYIKNMRNKSFEPVKLKDFRSESH